MFSKGIHNIVFPFFTFVALLLFSQVAFADSEMSLSGRCYLIKMYISQENTVSAKKEIKEALAVCPADSVEYRRYLYLADAMCDYLAKDYQGADRSIRRLISLDNQDMWVLENAAELYYKMEDYKNVLATCEMIFRLDPDNRQALAYALYSQYFLADYKAAIDDLMLLECWHDDFGMISPLYQKEPAYLVNKLKEQIVIDKDSTNYKCMDELALGYAYQSAENYDGVIECANATIQECGANIYAYDLLSATYLRFYQNDKAHAYADSLLMLDNSNVRGLQQKSLIYYDEGEYALSSYYARVMLKNETNMSVAYLMLGMCCYLEHDFEQAISYLDKAIESSNQWPYAYLMRGRAYSLINEKDKAVADFRAAMEYDKDNDDKTNLMFAYCYLGQFSKAEKIAIEQMNEKPDNANHLFSATGVFALSGKTDEAVNCLSKCLSLGFNRYTMIKNEPDFEPIRGTEGYKELAERYGF